MNHRDKTPATGSPFGTLATVAAGGLMMWLFFSFTADDAYIVARYAHHLATGQGLTFNPGERVSALTSPAQALLLTALERTGVDALGAYKILAIAGVLATLAAAAASLGGDSRERLLFLLLTACSPIVAMWTVGGLETPMLLIIITWLARLCLAPANGRALAQAMWLACLAFVVRYDSVLCSAPVIVAIFWGAWRSRSCTRMELAVAALPMVIPLAWLLFAAGYFGDILPTSFYVKTPAFDLKSLLKGAGYEVSALLVFGLWLFAANARRGSAWRPIFGSPMLGLAAGLGLISLYGLSAGTKHMMFGYRLFVPYLPAIILLLFAVREHGAISGRHVPVIAAAVLQACMFMLVWRVTVNPTLLTPWRLYEYPRLSLDAYSRDFLGALDANGASIATHWANLAARPQRAPRIATYAAGRLPAAMPDAYFFEDLVSYRHHCAHAWAPYADYIQILTPRHGTRAAQLGAVADARLIGVRRIRFDGGEESFEVWFNPYPQPFELPARVSDPCAK